MPGAWSSPRGPLRSPSIQYSPMELRIWLGQRFRPGWIHQTPVRDRARENVSQIRLLTRKELCSLVPDSLLFEEKRLGLVKSFVVYAGWE